MIVRLIECYLGELAQSSRKETSAASKTVQKWQRPAPTFLKVNCDAAFQRESGAGGWGYIIRDDEGDLISAGRGQLSHILDPFQAEVIACLQGLQAAIDLGISKPHLETDAFQVQQAVESKQLNLSIAGVDQGDKQVYLANVINIRCEPLRRQILVFEWHM